MVKIQKLPILKIVKFKLKLKYGPKDLEVKLERSKLQLKLRRMPPLTELMPKRLKEKLMLLLPRPLLLKLMLKLLLKELSPTTSKTE